jgi:hypothetical protein
MNNKKRVLTGLSTSLLMASSNSYAQDSVAGYMQRYNGFLLLMIAIATVVAVVYVITGIMHFRKSAHNAMQYPIADGIKPLVTGVALLALPFIYAVMINSFFEPDASWTGDTSSNDILLISNNITQIDEGTGGVFGTYIPAEYQAMGFFLMNAIGLFFLIRGIMQFRGGKDTSAKEGFIGIAIGILLMNPQYVYGMYMWFIEPIT